MTVHSLVTFSRISQEEYSQNELNRTLPNEILIQIFKKIHPRDRLSFCLVSSQWRKVGLIGWKDLKIQEVTALLKAFNKFESQNIPNFPLAFSSLRSQCLSRLNTQLTHCESFSEIQSAQFDCVQILENQVAKQYFYLKPFLSKLFITTLISYIDKLETNEEQKIIYILKSKFVHIEEAITSENRKEILKKNLEESNFRDYDEIYQYIVRAIFGKYLPDPYNFVIKFLNFYTSHHITPLATPTVYYEREFEPQALAFREEFLKCLQMGYYSEAFLLVNTLLMPSTRSEPSCSSFGINQNEALHFLFFCINRRDHITRRL